MQLLPELLLCRRTYAQKLMYIVDSVSLLERARGCKYRCHPHRISSPVAARVSEGMDISLEA